MFPEFDRKQLCLQSLQKRKSLLSIDNTILPLCPVDGYNSKLATIAKRILSARKNNRAVVMMLGGHVVRSGVQAFIIDLMEKGWISCIAVNGACVIHDFELALHGKTTESVAQYITSGQFGLWKETSLINDIVTESAKKKMGLGEAVGENIFHGDFKYKDTSILAAGYRLKIPITVHIGIGYDITHEMPNCNGAAYGETSYRDFLRFTHVLESLSKGVIMNFGSAVMAPEIFLKSLAMVRNVARQKGRKVDDFTTLVCDLRDIPENCSIEPAKSNPDYYFRPWKTMLSRTVATGGQSYYVKGRHTETIPQLWSAITNLARGYSELAK